VDEKSRGMGKGAGYWVLSIRTGQHLTRPDHLITNTLKKKPPGRRFQGWEKISLFDEFNDVRIMPQNFRL
jgi:hypothetical protein